MMNFEGPESGQRRSRRVTLVDDGLDVFLYGRRVGLLTSTGEGLRFQYHEDVVNEPTPALWALSVRLPVRARPYDHLQTKAFFDNLLPEGMTLEAIARARRLDVLDTVALLGILGGECAGAVSLWPIGQPPPNPPRYRRCTPKELTEYFDGEHPTVAVDANVRGRQALSGESPKLVLARAADGGLQYPQDGAPTTVLLKGGRARFPGIIENEAACLALMAAAGVPTVKATLGVLEGMALLESPRYDRIPMEDGRVRRLHQEDFCQAAGRQSMEKYSAHGGITVEEIAFVIRKFSTSAEEDIATFVRWVFANLCIGNQDAHAKNISLLHTSRGVRLAPVYDVLCTEVYDLPFQSLPLFIGSARTLESVNRVAIRIFAKMTGLTEAGVVAIASDVAERLAGRARDVMAATVPSQDKLVEQLGGVVDTHVRALRTTLSGS